MERAGETVADSPGNDGAPAEARRSTRGDRAARSIPGAPAPRSRPWPSGRDGAVEGARGADRELARAARMSLRAAISAKCKECVYDPLGGCGNWRQQVEACTARAC